MLTHDDVASENQGPVLGGKSTQLAWLHDVRRTLSSSFIYLLLVCSFVAPPQFRVEPAPGAADTYIIVHNASGRKLTYPKPPQDGSPVIASATEEGLWEILKEGGVDTFV